MVAILSAMYVVGHSVDRDDREPLWFFHDPGEVAVEFFLPRDEIIETGSFVAKRCVNLRWPFFLL